MPNTEKVQSVAELETLFEKHGSFFVTDYQGLNVADITQLRKALREGEVTFLVAKNTLFRIAARKYGFAELDPHFKGPTAVAFVSKDPSVAAKILWDSFKEKEKPRVKAFAIDGAVYSAADVQRVAELPPREVLLAQVVAAVESPLTSLVGSLDGFFTKLVGTIDALAEKRKGAA